MTQLTLSNVNPDFNDLLSQLQGYLSGIDSWQGSVTSQTGTGILSAISAMGAFDQAKIRRYYMDAFPETVISQQASYAIAEMQGVRLTRKSPANVAVTLTSTIGITIPAYSIFQGSGAYFFNRTAFFLAASTPTIVTLYEGQVQFYSMSGLGIDNAMFASTETGFVVSDVDVTVQINSTQMLRTTGGIWTLAGQIGFCDATLPTGQVLIKFGTVAFGGQPLTTDNLVITYVTTLGSDGNSLNTNGMNLTCPLYGSVTGVFNANPSSGADETPALSYKNLAASTFGVFNSAITRQQHITTALSYPGVVDVVTFAQREVNVNAVTWMNLVKVVLLTSSFWDTPAQSAFLTYMQNECAYPEYFFLDNPSPVVVNVSVTLYCFNWANSTTVQANVSNAIVALLAPKAGILNWDMHMTDLNSAIMNADPGIDYATITSPTQDVIVSNKPFLAPTIDPVLISGTLVTNTTYYYSIGLTLSSGVIVPGPPGWVTTGSSPTGVTVEWPAFTGGGLVNYLLYRSDGTSTNPLLLATVSPTAYPYYNDTNAVTPSGSPLPQNTTPVEYIQLGTLTLTSLYSNRNLRTST